MGELLGKTPVGEYLDGTNTAIDKVERTEGNPIPFKYRFPNQKEVDQIIENQPLKGLQMDKYSVIIYTSTPLQFRGSYEVLLETEKVKRKVKQVLYDHSNSRRSGLRLSGIANKDLVLGKLITFE